MAARQKREAAEKRRRGAPARPPKTGIGMLLRDADTAFNRYLTAQLAAHGVTFGQFQHLRNLWVENGLTQAELSRRIGIEMASSTAILDSLEAAKLITRVRNTTEFTFRPQGDQTAVTWSMAGRNNFVAKALCLFMNMDRMIGRDMENGLAQLKSVVEAAVKK